MIFKKNMMRQSGFTLIELSISILVISLIIAGIMTVENQRVRSAKVDELDVKLEAIGKALYRYRVLNNRLPCPGDSSLAKSNADFGVQADGADGACDAGTINSNINSSGGDVYGGSVPVRTLGLPDDVAFDAWGRQFTYYVDKNTTNSDNWTTEDGTAGVTDTDMLNVDDESSNVLDDDIFAVVISHGPNGHGSFNVAGNRFSANITNPQEQENCMCDEDAAAIAGDSSRTIRIQRTLPLNYKQFITNFDDIGRFYNKAYFYTYEEKNASN